VHHVLFVAGQSLAGMFIAHHGKGFDALVRDRAPEAPEVVVSGHAPGGTVASTTNLYTDDETREAWWDLEADAPTNVSRVALHKAGRNKKYCAALLWDQGQSDATAARGRIGQNPMRVVEDYAAATSRVLNALRWALRPHDPYSLPILFMPMAPPAPWHGAYCAGTMPILMRQKQIIAATPNCHVAGDLTEMTRQDSVHPDAAGMALYAGHVADAFVRHVIRPTI